MMDCPTEYAEQCKIIAWSRLMVATNQEPRLRLLRAGMEGVRLTIGTRVKAKRAGMDSAWPDLWLSIPKYEYIIPASTGTDRPLRIVSYGLYVEVKRLKGGTVSPEQKSMHQALREQGYRVEVAKGADAAIKCIKDYLGMED